MRICNRDCVWPSKPEILTLCPFREKIAQLFWSDTPIGQIMKLRPKMTSWSIQLDSKLELEVNIFGSHNTVLFTG